MRTTLVLLIAPLLGIAVFDNAGLMTATAAPPVSPAVETLTQKGLVKKGNFWLLTEEAKVMDSIKELPQLEKKCHDAQLQYDEVVRQGKLAKEQFDKTRKEYDQIQTLLKSGTNTAAQQSKLAAENDKRVLLLQKLEPAVVDLTAPAENAAFRTAAIELSGARSELIAALSYMQAQVPTFEERYQALHDDADVAAALMALGPGTRLGPSRNYKKDPPRTSTAEKLVFNNTLPLYRDKLRIVFDVILNDKLTFPIGDGRVNDFTMLPASAIDSSGQKIPADAPEVNLNADGKTYKCRLVKLNSVRIGKYVLKDVEVVALPADATIITPALGRKTLEEYDLTTDPTECRITIKSLADAEKEKANDKKGPAKTLTPPTLPKG